MENNKYISLKICGNPNANSGFMPLISFNSPTFNIPDTVYNGFNNNSYFFTIVIEKDKVVYKLIKNNVSSYGAGRRGSLFIAFSIPKGYKLESKSPFDVLIELKDQFISQCMICINQQNEKFQFNHGAINSHLFDDYAKNLILKENIGPFRPMNPQGNIAYITVHKDQIKQLLSDVQYQIFSNYQEIIIAESADGPSYNQIQSLKIPREPEYYIFKDNNKDKIITNINEVLSYKGEKNQKYYDNKEIKFTINGLLNDNNLNGNVVSIDKTEEKININTSNLSTPKEYKIKIEFRDSDNNNNNNNSIFNTSDFKIYLHHKELSVDSSFSFTLKGEEIKELLQSPISPNVVRFHNNEFLSKNIEFKESDKKLIIKVDKIKTSSNNDCHTSNIGKQEFVKIKIALPQEEYNPDPDDSDKYELKKIRISNASQSIELKKLTLKNKGHKGETDEFEVPKYFYEKCSKISFILNKRTYTGNIPKCKDSNTIEVTEFERERKKFKTKLFIKFLITFLAGLAIGACSQLCYNKFFGDGNEEQNDAAGISTENPENSSSTYTKGQSDNNKKNNNINKEGQNKFTCPECGPDMWFKTQKELDSHMEKHHKNKNENPNKEIRKIFTCPECGQDSLFNTQKELDSHKENCHKPKNEIDPNNER